MAFVFVVCCGGEDMIVLHVVVALGLGHTPMHGPTYHKPSHFSY